MLSRMIKCLPPVLRRNLGNLAGDERAIIAPTYAAVFLTMMLALGLGVDMSNGLQAKYQLDLAADAAAVACGETWQAYMEAGAGVATTTTTFNQLVQNANTAGQNAGTAAFLAQSALLGVQGKTNPTAGTPTILAAGSPSVVASEPSNTPNILQCNATYTAKNLNYLMQLVGFKALTVNGKAQSAVILPPYVAVYLIVDTSSSMMVGSTAADSELVATWVRGSVTTGKGKSAVTTYNACQVWSTAAQPTCTNTRTCGFACHDVSEGSISDMLSFKKLGESVAQYQGAKTRFDVMRLALVNDTSTTPDPDYCTTSSTAPTSNPTWSSQTATPVAVQCDTINGKGLLAYIRDTYQVPNARQNLNTFTYSLYGFNEGINGFYEPYSGSNDYSQYTVPTGYTAQAAAPFGVQDLSTVAIGVNKLMLGDDTHLNDRVMPGIVSGGNGQQAIVTPTLASSSKQCAAGTCANNPLKFIIFVTDGLNSDRSSNWDSNVADQYTTAQLTTFCSTWGTPIPDYPGTSTPQWTGTAGQCNNSNYSPGFFGTATGAQSFSPNYSSKSAASQYVDIPQSLRTKQTGFPDGISSTLCTTLRKNGGTVDSAPLYGTIPGVTIAVLETPYVPLTGQDPGTWPYERTVEATMFPTGPGGGSYISTALSNCATPSQTPGQPSPFYFQATSDSQIANGFVTLFDTYVGQWVHLTQ